MNMKELYDKMNDLYSKDEEATQAKQDDGKPKYSLCPPAIIEYVTKVREFAVNGKYKDPNNWELVEPKKFWDALLRHCVQSWDNMYSLDKESGLPHLAHIACNAAFLLQFYKENEEKNKNVFD